MFTQRALLPIQRVYKISTMRPPRFSGHRQYNQQNRMSFSSPHVATPTWLTALHVGIFVVGAIIPVVLVVQFVDDVPVSGRHRIMLVGRDAERALGKTLYKRVMSESRLLPSSHPLVQAVTAIGTRIAAAVHDVEETSSGSVESQLVEVVEKGLGRPKVEHPKEPDEVTSNGRQAESLAEMLRTSTASSGGPVAVAKADNWDWHFIVVDNPAKNAYCIPGGTVVVFTGMLKFIDEGVEKGVLKTREHALATVMSHEIAHALCRHGSEKLSFRATLLPFVDVLLAQSSPLLHWLYVYLHELPYSRLMEREADEVGLLLLSRACYDCSQAEPFYAALDSTPASLEWSSTHPVGQLRAQDARRGASVLVPLQPQWCSGGAAVHGDPNQAAPSLWSAVVLRLLHAIDGHQSVESMLTFPKDSVDSGRQVDPQ